MEAVVHAHLLHLASTSQFAAENQHGLLRMRDGAELALVYQLSKATTGEEKNKKKKK